MNKEKPIVKNKMIDLIQSCRFKGFVAEEEGRFEQEHGFFRPIIKKVADRIINHLKLTFFAERPPAAASRHPLAHLELNLTSDDARSIMPCDGLGENWRVDTH